MILRCLLKAGSVHATAQHVEPRGSLYPAILPELLQAGLRVRCISRKARPFLQLEVGKPDAPGAVGNGGDHRHAHDAHILLFIAQIASENLKKLSGNSQVGIEIVLEYEDGSTESRFIDLY